MGQRICTLLWFLIAMILFGCDKPGDALPATQAGSAAPAATPVTTTATIVSLTPAGTDLVLGMGLRDRLAGVSTYDVSPGLVALPRVGDYLKVDWEKIAELKPGYLLVQGQPDRLPPGLKERSDEMGVRLVAIQIDRLADIRSMTTRVGEAMGAPAQARELVARLDETLAKYTAKAGRAVPALIVTSENAKFVAGRANFLDDLLVLAGGENVIVTPGYVTIDQEKLLTLRPEVIFILMPGGTPASVEQARQSLAGATDLPAVKTGRIVPITRDDVLVPGPTAAMELAKEFSAALSPAGPTTGRATP